MISLSPKAFVAVQAIMAIAMKIKTDKRAIGKNLGLSTSEVKLILQHTQRGHIYQKNRIHIFPPFDRLGTPSTGACGQKSRQIEGLQKISYLPTHLLTYTERFRAALWNPYPKFECLIDIDIDGVPS